jgi:hypothetical protein
MYTFKAILITSFVLNNNVIYCSINFTSRIQSTVDSRYTRFLYLLYFSILRNISIVFAAKFQSPLLALKRLQAYQGL